MRIPEHLPPRLTISPWDFSWYTMTMPGEPYADLERAFGELRERGFNAVRVCAMPLLLFDPAGRRRPGPLRFASLGGEFGQRVRGYNCRGGGIVDGHARLSALLQTARRHGAYVILSSWEYQQSAAFLHSPELFAELMAVPPADRFAALARAMGALLAFVKEEGLIRQVAYVELHHEVDRSRLADVAGPGEDVLAAERPYLEQAIAWLRAAHPDVLVTASYACPTLWRLDELAANVQVGHFHLYAPGVLAELTARAGVEENEGVFPTAFARSLLREDAPEFASWAPPPGQEWRLEATRLDRRLFYLYDWADPVRFDRYLYEHYVEHRQAMRREIQERLQAYAEFARRRGIPAVIGAGYLGLTPLLASFEDGPIGKDIAEFAVGQALALDYWGLVLGDNAAPHHPFWADVAWQRRQNERILNYCR